MHSYFGSGYLLNLLQRGAAPIAPSRRQGSFESLRSETTFAPADNQLAEVQSEVLDLLTEPVAIAETPGLTPQTASADVLPRVETAATATTPVLSAADKSADVLSGMDHTPVVSPRAELNEQQRALAPPVPARLPAQSTPLAAAGSEYFEPAKLSASNDNSLGVPRPANAVFELKMPDNFFRQPANAAVAKQNEPEARALEVSARPAPTAGAVKSGAPVKSDPAPGLISPTSSDSAGNSAKTVNEIAVRGQASGEPQAATRLVQPQISEPQAAPQTHEPPSASQPGGEVSSVDPKQSEAPATPPALASAPLPRQESIAERAMFRPPPITQFVANPPARLRINRLDINIVNAFPAPPPTQTRSSDVSQLLDREHLGRVDLIR